MTRAISRSGRFVKQPTGYRVFIPAALPPDPPIDVDAAMGALLSRADQAIGRLDGAIFTLPDPDLFVAMYVRQEAVLSSQIEGTQSSLDDVLAFELDPEGQETPQDVTEVVNYIQAMNHGLERLDTLPLSLRLIREIHEILLAGTRGAHKQPGEFRTSQNWIGVGNVTLHQAAFVPHRPPRCTTPWAILRHSSMRRQRFLFSSLVASPTPQFETIHPFLAGNGRAGRLLITFLLVHRGVLHQPLLYLSTFLKRNRAEYYDRLTAIRETGDWEGWLRFFLRGVADTAEEAMVTARAIVRLREEHRGPILQQGLGMNGLRLHDLLFHFPMINIRFLEERLDIAFVTANRLVKQFEALGLLVEVTGGKRNRRFLYAPYIRLFDAPSVDSSDAGPI